MSKINLQVNINLFQAGWTNEQFPDGMLEPAWKTIVYSTHGAMEVNVMKRRCVNLACYRYYDGCEDSLFLLSKSIAVGYELGWEYVEGVLRNKMTFSGFTKGVQDRYSRFTSPCNFMAANTFIRWWFAWASAMRINFVEQCFSCGNDIKILACDGTKIGYTLKQANVRPIESPDDPTGLVHQTISRRFDRTLITNSIDSVERKAINVHLTSLANNVLNETVIENDQMHFIMTVNTTIPIEIKQLIFHMCQCPTINVIERKSVASLLILILFLWFCPAHGHCYGFHVIPGSEGRKDPANSLYTFLSLLNSLKYGTFAFAFYHAAVVRHL